MNIFKEI
jgi:hypothetical protein